MIIKRQNLGSIDYSELEIEEDFDTILPKTVGEFLKEDLLNTYHITQYQLAKSMGVPETRISEIIKGKRSISVDTALRLEAFFGMSAEFWLRMDNGYKIRLTRQQKKQEIQKIPKFLELAH